MGYLVTRGSKASTKGQNAGGPRSSKWVDSYNRSSLAVDLQDDGAALAWKPMPHLVPRPALVTGPAPRMFAGLEPALAQKDKKSNAISFMVHTGIIALVLGWGMAAHKVVQEQIVTPIKFTLTDPPVMQVAKVEGGGGGGGAHQVPPPVKAVEPPKPVAPHIKLMPAQIARLDKPKLAEEPDHQVNMQLASNMPQLGMADSPQVALKSQGSGAHSGFGSGMGGGIGIGQSSGNGPGSGGGYGGGVMSVGGGVSAPVVVHSVEPEFTEQARRSDLQGTVAVQLIVDSQGNPQDVRVARRLGMGLDEKAVEAVRQYKFRPAMYQGHPVAVQMIIEVDFRLH